MSIPIQDANRHSVPSPILLHGLSDVEGFEGGESNIETKATTKAWHEGLEMLRLFKYILFYAVIDEDEDNN